MWEVGVVLAMYLALVGIAAWQWVRQPPAVGYYLCGVLALLNVGMLVTAREWLPHDQVSVLRGVIYAALLALQGGVLLLVGGKLQRQVKAHLGMARLPGGVAPAPPELTPLERGLLLGAAGAGSLVGVELILSRRVFFLQPGSVWIVYVILGTVALANGLAWLQSRRQRRRAP